MSSVTLNDAYNSYINLDYSEKEALFDLIQKQLIDERREEILKRATEAENNFINGKIKGGTAEQVMEFLDD